MLPRRKISILTLLLFFLLLLAGCGKAVIHPNGREAGQYPATPAVGSNGLRVHFLDVGQGDAALLQFPEGEVLLVDAGKNVDGPEVVDYLKRQGIRRIDYLVGTHPHEDHIGGLDLVIQKFQVGQIYMPRKAANTRSYEELLRQIERKGLRIKEARAGTVICERPDLKAVFIAPVGTKYEDLNNWSAVVHVQYGKTAVLLAGDAEKQSEQDMLASGANLKADLLKLGHHGSRDSTSRTFLSAVSPRYAVISVGKDNEYGHPHKEILARLASEQIEVYRTDRDGTVVFVSDGNALRVEK